MLPPMMGRGPQFPSQIQYPRPTSPLMPARPIASPQPAPGPIYGGGGAAVGGAPAFGGRVLGMMHKGGTINKTGLYEMQKGEKVKKAPHSTGKLSSAERKALPTGTFALAGRRYPIENASHARNALARVSQFGTSAEKAKVRGAVYRKYPSIGQKHKMVSVGALGS